jgi:hypothetical protein
MENTENSLIPVFILAGSVIGIGLIVLIGSIILKRRSFRCYRRLCGGQWVKTYTHMSPGMAMGGYGGWQKKNRSSLGGGDGISYTEVLDSEDYFRKKNGRPGKITEGMPKPFDQARPMKHRSNWS